MNQPLLILDLDETLVYATEEPIGTPADFTLGQYAVYRRPYLVEFLEVASSWYQVAVWSSASAGYVAGIVRAIIPEPERLRFVWSEARCTSRYHPELFAYYPVKDLRKVKRLGYSLERMVMLDDSPEKLERHYGNHLPIRSFEGSPDDTELRDLLPFLEWLRDVPNFRMVEKRGGGVC